MNRFQRYPKTNDDLQSFQKQRALDRIAEIEDIAMHGRNNKGI